MSKHKGNEKGIWVNARKERSKRFVCWPKLEMESVEGLERAKKEKGLENKKGRERFSLVQLVGHSFSFFFWLFSFAS